MGVEDHILPYVEWLEETLSTAQREDAEKVLTRKNAIE